MTDLAWNGEIHPAALIFPMLSEAELTALAADIAAHGLIEPLRLHPASGELLDGRNRLAACERANVAPRFEPAEMNGSDPLAYVVSKNVHRRNLRAGATAIAAARAWDVFGGSGDRGRPKKGSDELFPGRTAERIAAVFGIGAATVKRARALVERDPPAADDVANGAMTLQAAYDALRERERRAESQQVKLDRVKRRRPDLAERIEAAELSIDEADDLLAADEARERQQRETMVTNITGAIQVLARPAPHAAELVNELELAEHPYPWKPADARVASDFLSALADRLTPKGRQR